MTSAGLIDLASVSAGYGRTTVLHDVSLSIDSTAFSGIVGPSGAGKTTLLRVLLGLIKPSSGTRTTAPSLRVAYVPQLETVDWKFPVTVFECVLMARTEHRFWPWPSAQERQAVAAVLDRLGIADLADRHIRELSGGQQQRMFLARALLREPQVLLLDEPTSGVDITTHDLNGMAAHLPHLVCVNGHVVAEGAPRDVIVPSVLEETFGARLEVLQHLGMPIVVDGAYSTREAT